jgi:LacI family transcriptional regulator
VDADDEAIARLAFAHFTERGFRHFAFVGNDSIGWSRHRRHAFEQLVKDARVACHSFTVRQRATVAAGYSLPPRELERWVVRLPHPCAVFAAWDGFGRHVLRACKRAKLDVPDEVSVLGVGDDALEADLIPVPLSSIVPDAEGAGYRAAALLDQLMAGQRNLPQHIALPPLRVVARQSTDALAYEDRRVAAAVRLIRAQACQGLRVGDVVQAVPLSRRQLDLRFHQHLGHSPHQEIQRVRLCRAKELLSDTDLTLSAIAHQLGFEHPEYFSVLFKRIIGMSPGSYRRQVRAAT